MSMFSLLIFLINVSSKEALKKQKQSFKKQQQQQQQKTDIVTLFLRPFTFAAVNDICSIQGYSTAKIFASLCFSAFVAFTCNFCTKKWAFTNKIVYQKIKKKQKNKKRTTETESDVCLLKKKMITVSLCIFAGLFLQIRWMQRCSFWYLSLFEDI